ncbi:MAG: hypothetical protein LBV19_10235 [Streptococcaceae bacterium]|jgi:hypothetical protein|nr:hypothetical protein [Streptococcaceae bacterium]
MTNLERWAEGFESFDEVESALTNSLNWIKDAEVWGPIASMKDYGGFFMPELVDMHTDDRKRRNNWFEPQTRTELPKIYKAIHSSCFQNSTIEVQLKGLDENGSAFESITGVVESAQEKNGHDYININGFFIDVADIQHVEMLEDNKI